MKKLNQQRKWLKSKDDGTVGGLISHNRLRNDMTQTDLAKHLRIRPTQLNEIEKNKRPVSLELAVRAARKLMVPTEVIIERWMLAKVQQELGKEGIKYSVLCLKGIDFRGDERESYERYFGGLLTTLDGVRGALVQFNIRAALETVIHHLKGSQSKLSTIQDLSKRDTLYKLLGKPIGDLNPTLDTLQFMLNTLRTASTPGVSDIGKTLVKE